MIIIRISTHEDMVFTIWLFCIELIFCVAEGALYERKFTDMALRDCPVGTFEVFGKLGCGMLCEVHQGCLGFNIERTAATTQCELSSCIDENIAVAANGYDYYSKECAPGFEKFEGHCYFFSIDRKTWTAARQACMDEDTDLVSLETDAELEFANQMSSLPAWTSGSDEGEEGTWVWLATGQAVESSRWKATEPNNMGGIEHHLQIWPTGEFNDNSANQMAYFVCEYEL